MEGLVTIALAFSRSASCTLEERHFGLSSQLAAELIILCYIL